MKNFASKRMLALGGALALSVAMFGGVTAYAATADDSTEVIAQVEEAVEDGIHEALPGGSDDFDLLKTADDVDLADSVDQPGNAEEDIHEAISE